ncbi:hypothetical protein NSA56_11180 [Oceanobacillus caeni]|uniref:hypothetical protein n=1 Tax=Oceanobacillus caeni TaxID=405946 RepID=UPI002149AB4A|nr:hypothetical protein [Oceanobacillus caeni]MCR1834957.1 hypothetical protein [Oceanobacillus caeni]
MDKALVDKYIAMPMAITVFKQDTKSFEESKVFGVYLDKIESVLKQLKKDFYSLKRDMITKYHLDIRCIDQCKYRVNGRIIDYTPEELKAITADIMREYLYGGKATADFEQKEHLWKQ